MEVLRVVIDIMQVQKALDDINYHLDLNTYCFEWKEDKEEVRRAFELIQLYVNQQNEKAAAEEFAQILRDM